MRHVRIAALVVGITTAADGQSPIASGDSVRVTRKTSESQIGTVRRLDRDSLVLQDGAAFPLTVLQQIEKRGDSGPLPGRRFGFGLLGALGGVAAGALIPCIWDSCGGLAQPGLIGGAIYGATVGGRKKERVWRVAWTPKHTIESVTVSPSDQAVRQPDAEVRQAAVVMGPPIEASLLSTLQAGEVLRIWTDSSRTDGQFVRVDDQQRVLYLRNAAREVPLTQIYGIHVRVDRRGDYALIVGAITTLGAALVRTVDCEFKGCESSHTAWVIGTAAAIGITGGALLGSRVETWRTLYTRN